LIEAVKPGESTHSLTLVLDRPLSKETKRLRLKATFESKPAPELANAVKLSATNDPSLRRRAELPPGVGAALETPSAKRSTEQIRLLGDYYREKVAGKATLDAIAKLDSSRPKAATVPIMRELAKEKQRVTKLLEKGNFLQPGETVTAQPPAGFHQWPKGAPYDRSGLAEWLTSRDNPLTARVAVNRLWARLFGRGLVETEEDFGVQGEHPSHPELLDWLANEYIRTG
jgi:hypothetical protein